MDVLFIEKEGLISSVLGSASATLDVLWGCFLCTEPVASTLMELAPTGLLGPAEVDAEMSMLVVVYRRSFSGPGSGRELSSGLWAGGGGPKGILPVMAG
jgi:hypothetical protein